MAILGMSMAQGQQGKTRDIQAGLRWYKDGNGRVRRRPTERAACRERVRTQRSLWIGEGQGNGNHCSLA